MWEGLPHGERGSYDVESVLLGVERERFVFSNNIDVFRYDNDAIQPVGRKC